MICLTPTVVVLAVRARVKTRAILPKRQDNSLFLRRKQKIKTVIKLLCLLLMLNIRIPVRV